MDNPFNFLVGVAAVCSLWFLWDGPLKSFALDAFREQVFKLRFSLFELGMTGELAFESETYRTIETLMNGMLRYGHRFTFMSYVHSLIEDQKAQKHKDYVDFAMQLDIKISQAPPSAQSAIRDILKNVQTAVIVYMSLTSLLFLVAAAAMLVLRMLRLVQFSGRRIVGAVIEREAYEQASRDTKLVTA